MTHNVTFEDDPMVAEAVALRQFMLENPGEAARDAFTEWMMADPRHVEVWVGLTEFDEEVAHRLERKGAGYLRGDSGDEVGAQERVVSPMGPATDKRKLSPASVVALAAGLLVLTVLGVWYSQIDGVERYSVGIGEMRRVVLSDGSAVTLNTGTKVRVRVTETSRQVTVLQGEALFDVEKDAGSPFKVIAGDAVVRATGTQFSVRVHEPSTFWDPFRKVRVDVLVSEGTVAIDRPDTGGKRYDAGTLATVSGDVVSETKLAFAEVSPRLEWTAGRIRLTGQPLSSVVEEFNRYNEQKLVVDDPSIATLKCGGVFSATDVDAFVKSLKPLGVGSKVDSSAFGRETIYLFAIR
jgi:transmembrane sensor